MPEKKIFELNVAKLATWLTPEPLRLPVILSMVSAIAVMVRGVYERFYAGYIATQYRLGVTAQAVSLQRALNDRWDVQLRRIRILPAVEFPPVLLYKPEENRPLVINQPTEGSPLVLYTTGETAEYVSDFIVQAPADMVFDMAEMAAFVDAFKLESKNFKIFTI
jgi:hypothetical protein